MIKNRYMEFQFDKFQSEYRTYQNNPNIILAETNRNSTRKSRKDHLLNLFAEFRMLDVKMRLAFGISEIRLNRNFVSGKEADLKDCHLLYYKLADLWFAYEVYIKFYKAVTTQTKKKIVWLDEAVYNSYSTSESISHSLGLVRTKFTSTYNTNAKRNELVGYLKHCEQEAINQQKTRLSIIINSIKTSNFNFSHTDILTIIYSIRNNFVHNGETTVVPDDFGFRNKSMLLKILYQYLCIILLKSTNITCGTIQQSVLQT